MRLSLFSFFFFNDTATTEIYTLSLHDALPIYCEDLRKRNPNRTKRRKQRSACTGGARVRTLPGSRSDLRQTSRHIYCHRSPHRRVPAKGTRNPDPGCLLPTSLSLDFQATTPNARQIASSERPGRVRNKSPC